MKEKNSSFILVGHTPSDPEEGCGGACGEEYSAESQKRKRGRPALAKQALLVQQENLKSLNLFFFFFVQTSVL